MEQFKNAVSCDKVMSPVVRLFDNFSIKFNDSVVELTIV